jgi:putative ABC transport system permease protein
MIAMWWMALRLAVFALARNKLRAALTVLGILIGVSAVVAMTALGEGARESIERQMSAVGTNLIWVWPGAAVSSGVRGEAGSRPTLSEDDGRAIAREIVAVQAVAPTLGMATQVVSGSRNVATRITGTTEDYFVARAWPLARGRLFDEADMRSAAKVCILGETVRRALFGHRDPVGERIRLGRLPCEVIGLLAPKGQGSFGQDYDDTVVMPITTVRARLRGSAGREVDQVMISVRNPLQVRQTQQRIGSLLRQRHRLLDHEENDFSVRNLQEMMETLERTRGTLTALLLAIACIALLVGGIGVMNIMLVSVTERTREIGIRLAVGARSADILAQFLVEAVTLSAIGGVVGLALGVGAGMALGKAMDWNITFSPTVALIALGTSSGIGVVFGFFPARRAAALDPITALRHE